MNNIRFLPIETDTDTIKIEYITYLTFKQMERKRKIDDLLDPINVILHEYKMIINEK